MLEEIAIDDYKWNEIVKSFNSYDFYHLSEYHKMESTGEPKLLHYTSNKVRIAFPVVIRSIEGTNYFDLTSVYGYGGPLCNRNDLNDLEYEGFINELDSYFFKKKIIAAFSRLHPLINTSFECLNGYGDILSLNKTVSIDLSLSVEDQRKCFRKSTKYDIGQLEKKGIIVREASSENDLMSFIQIYKQSMDRVDAHSYYYFTEEYFRNFLKNIDSLLLVAVKEEQVIAGAIFTFNSDIMQYHLAGTADDFLTLAPMKLILNHARLIGTERGLKYLHLGGGVGGEDDALFRFKSGFSKNFYQFKIWKHIINPNIYNDLVKMKFGDNIPDSNYFPLYRLNN